MRTQRLIAYMFAACLVSPSAGLAMADDERGHPNSLLKGKYRFSQNNACVIDSNGFTDQLVTLGSGFPVWLYLTGVANYDGVGNVTVKDQGIFIAGPGPFQSGSSPVSTFEDNCSGTYSVNHRDRSFVQHMSCKATDESYTLTGIEFEGQIGLDGSVLTMSSTEPVVQTLAGNGFANKRICGAHVTSVRIRRE